MKSFEKKDSLLKKREAALKTNLKKRRKIKKSCGGLAKSWLEIRK